MTEARYKGKRERKKKKRRPQISSLEFSSTETLLRPPAVFRVRGQTRAHLPANLAFWTYIITGHKRSS